MEKRTTQEQHRKKATAEQSEIAALRKELEQLKAEYALLKGKFEMYSEVAEEGLYIHEDFVLKEANSAFERMTGYSQAELFGMHGSQLLTPESIELLKKNIFDARFSF